MKPSDTFVIIMAIGITVSFVAAIWSSRRRKDDGPQFVKLTEERLRMLSDVERGNWGGKHR